MSTFFNSLTEYSPQLEASDFMESEYLGGPQGGVFSEAEEMELAAELLGVANEEELDYFLGGLVRAAGGVLGKLVNSRAGKAIGGVLRTVARRALPFAGGAVGAAIGGPLGAKLGSALASGAGGLLGLELEGLSPEDREFQAARQFVRFAGSTVQNALETGSGDSPQQAQEAARSAARVHAPGLMDLQQSKKGGKVMHDLDRTQVGFGYETEDSGWNREEGSLYEGEQATPYEMEESELVNELMEVQSEEEFESFLKRILSRAVSAAGGFLGSSTGKAVGGLLKGAARQILPLVQQVAGSQGEMEGEFEGEGGSMSEEEMEQLEWEAAETFVRLAQETAVNAAQAPPDADPKATAQKALTDAAQIHAPSLVAPSGQARQPASRPSSFPGQRPCACKGGRRGNAGRWIRRGNQILLLGV